MRELSNRVRFGALLKGVGGEASGAPSSPAAWGIASWVRVAVGHVFSSPRPARGGGRQYRPLDWSARRTASTNR